MAYKTMKKKPGFSYTQVQLNTAGPGNRVVMMYDGILKNLRMAKEKMKMNDPAEIEATHNHLQLAERLILELKLALDHDKGGEIATNLDSLYTFWIDHISQANMNKDQSRIVEVISMVKSLRDAWDQAAKEALKMGIV